MYGKRLMMLVCIVVMTAGSLVAALSAGSFLTADRRPVAAGFRRRADPDRDQHHARRAAEEKVGSAIALMSATLGIGGALGLPLGGIIFEQLGWQAIFWLSAGVGVAHRRRGAGGRAGIDGQDPGPVRRAWARCCCRSR